MEGLESATIVQKIAGWSGLPPLAVEAGFLLFLTGLILLMVFIVEAILRIRKEFIKLNQGAGYILHLLTRGDEHPPALGDDHFFNPIESPDDIRVVVLKMLQEGKTHDEIKEHLDVSEPYIKGVRKWAFDEGTLFKKPDNRSRK